MDSVDVNDDEIVARRPLREHTGFARRVVELDAKPQGLESRVGPELSIPFLGIGY